MQTNAWETGFRTPNRNCMKVTQMGLLSDDELSAIDDSHNWQTTEGRMAAYRAILAKLQATQADHIPDAGEMVTQEPVQAGELPPYIYGREAGPNEKVWTEQAVRAALSARKPLTVDRIDEIANSIHTEDPMQWWRNIARAIERAHGIGLEVKHG